MQTIGINKDWKNRPGHFSILVLAPDERSWEERSYAFKHEENKVYFLFGGGEKEKRLAGEADTEEERIKKAIKYLEWWLKKSDAIGVLESAYNLKIHPDDPRGGGFFGLQIWTWDQEKIRHDTIFYFQYTGSDLYYLGTTKKQQRELVRFMWKDRKDQAEKELLVSPTNKEEAMEDAIDYLEWRYMLKNL